MGGANEHKGAGHRQRLRERFLQGGLAGFHDYEVVELLLTLGTPRRDCKAAAKTALERFKTLQGVLEAEVGELKRIAGIGPKNVFGIKLVKAAAERYLAGKMLGRDLISDSRALFDYLRVTLRDKQRELFVAIFLNAKNRVLATETLSEGSLTASSIYPREVVQAALRHHAAAVIFAHNHPSGDPQPSAEDMAATRRLLWAHRLMEITVHEHIVVGAEGYFSFADHGLISRFNQEFDRLARQAAQGSPGPAN